MLASHLSSNPSVVSRCLDHRELVQGEAFSLEPGLRSYKLHLSRCPTECKLSHSNSSWKCLVKLHFSTDASGVPVPVKVVPFGGPITDKSLVEDRIRRAQRAILNPSKDPNKFLHRDEVSDENDVSFSKNYVSLEISGSELADLSFVDLPGLIASVGRGSDDRDIELVKSLVTSYISKQSCVILLTVACESGYLCFDLHYQISEMCSLADFENQGAHHLAKQYDPDGKRTVGESLLDTTFSLQHNSIYALNRCPH